MLKIRIENFSCITIADVSLASTTIIVGPQASGKSVISKLIYFCIRLMNFASARDPREFKDFNSEAVEDFKKWFPPSAWGKKRFTIQFCAGPIEITIVRTASGKGPSKNVKIKFSEYFVKTYREAAEAIAANKARTPKKGRDLFEREVFDFMFRIQNAVRTKLATDLEGDYVNSQVFIPAGRSFFTTVGKAVAAFEHGGLLDPVTAVFGRMFARLRDSGRYYPRSRDDKTLEALRKSLALQFFGGTIRVERDKEYVESPDGRVVPFSILSSGQQELLPLWMVLEDVIRSGRDGQLLYIEEPEAHLFPSSQGSLVEYLATLNSGRTRRRLMITTHSPYVLSKTNNLLKAGQLANELGKESEQAIAAVIRREFWLRSGSVSAYAVVNKELVPIIDDDGLIDGEYLDEVSGEISREFLALLKIESGHESG